MLNLLFAFSICAVALQGSTNEARRTNIVRIAGLVESAPSTSRCDPVIMDQTSAITSALELDDVGILLGNPASVFNNHQVCTVNGRVFDPSYGTAYFTLADWEDSLAGHWVKRLLEINESFYNCDVNNDGDSDDIVPAVPVYLARPNQPGYELDAPVRYTW